jgi:hypothetical protein
MSNAYLLSRVAYNYYLNKCKQHMGVLGKLLKFNGLLFATGAGVTMYQYPELRREPG